MLKIGYTCNANATDLKDEIRTIFHKMEKTKSLKLISFSTGSDFRKPLEDCDCYIVNVTYYDGEKIGVGLGETHKSEVDFIKKQQKPMIYITHQNANKSDKHGLDPMAHIETINLKDSENDCMSILLQLYQEVRKYEKPKVDYYTKNMEPSKVRSKLQPLIKKFSKIKNFNTSELRKLHQFYMKNSVNSSMSNNLQNMIDTLDQINTHSYNKNIDLQSFQSRYSSYRKYVIDDLNYLCTNIQKDFVYELIECLKTLNHVHNTSN